MRERHGGSQPEDVERGEREQQLDDRVGGRAVGAGDERELRGARGDTTTQFVKPPCSRAAIHPPRA